MHGRWLAPAAVLLLCVPFALADAAYQEDPRGDERTVNPPGMTGIAECHDPAADAAFVVIDREHSRVRLTFEMHGDLADSLTLQCNGVPMPATHRLWTTRLYADADIVVNVEYWDQQPQPDCPRGQHPAWGAGTNCLGTVDVSGSTITWTVPYSGRIEYPNGHWETWTSSGELRAHIEALSLMRVDGRFATSSPFGVVDKAEATLLAES